MKKYLLSATCLMLLLFWPIQAQEVGGPSAPDIINPVRIQTGAETRFLTQLERYRFGIDRQGILLESLDGSAIYTDINSDFEFNPASVIKVATSFAALFKWGPAHQFETAFYADGEIDKKTRTLHGDLILASSGDPTLSSTDLNRLLRKVINAGIARVNGSLVVTGPFTYASYFETARATRGLEALLRKLGVRVSGPTQDGEVAGTLIATHASSSLRDIVFQQNARSVNITADRMGESVGGPEGVRRFLIEQVGIHPTEISIQRTSGLHINRITPRATVQTMRHLVHWLAANEMVAEDVMPVAGIDQGTLRARFTQADYRGAIVGKTGTLISTDGGVASLAGVIYTRDQGPLLFAIFNTRGPVLTYRQLQDKFLKDLITELGGAEPNASLRRSNN